jgi:hypothetical protein
MVFRFIEFNPHRYARGAEAARVECDGQWLWMSKQDIENNIKEWGRDPELLMARAAYKTPTERFHYSMLENLTDDERHRQ